MPKSKFSFHASDISARAGALNDALVTHAEKKATPPTYLEMLNLLAKAAGARDFQAWREREVSSTTAKSAPQVLEEKIPPVVEKALRVFDSEGRMTRWPVARPVQRLCTWFMWSRFAQRRIYAEREVNDVLKPWNTFTAHETMRSELINDGLMQREPDGSKYQRIEVTPPPEVREFLKAMAKRVKSS